MRIGITQRVDLIADYEETRDSLDQRWSELIEFLGAKALPIPNKIKDINLWLDEMRCDGFILSGGNDLSSLSNSKNISFERDKTEFALLQYANDQSIPVLGVCRGFQIMNVFFGGKLKQISGHVAKPHVIKFCLDKSDNWSSRKVNSFHEWGISKNNLAKDLVACAYDENAYVEAAIHKKLNWLGMMWHPERNEIFEELDLDIIKKLFAKDLN